MMTKEDLIQTEFEIKLDFLNKNVLPYCKDQRVLEVGCFSGEISEQIIKHNPKELILLEAAAVPAARAQEKVPAAKVIVGDMHEDMDQVGPVDLVLLLGVIYHSHAPLHVLEHMVQHCDPEMVIIDNPGNSYTIGHEISNKPGMRYVVDNRRTCQLICNLPDSILTLAMKNLGYKLIDKKQYPQHSRASNAPIFYFKKYE